MVVRTKNVDEEEQEIVAKKSLYIFILLSTSSKFCQIINQLFQIVHIKFQTSGIGIPFKIYLIYYTHGDRISEIECIL